MPRAAVVVLNFNSWKHTIECLESVLRLNTAQKCIVLCDNNSSDDSVHRIRDWANSAAGFEGPENREFEHYFSKEADSFRFIECSAKSEAALVHDENVIYFITNPENRGFAAGNNEAIRFSLKNLKVDYIWLLNNDTIVPPDALNNLLAAAERNPDVGMVGSRLVHYYHPNLNQELGGATYNKYFGVLKPVGADTAVNEIIDERTIQSKLDYVSAASALISCSLLSSIGLLAEEYFLYFEELDLAKRSEKKYRLAFASSATVYHKHGGSIGSSTNVRERSLISEYFGFRARILFTRKFYPYLLPLVLANIFLISLPRRVFAGEFKKAKAILLAICNVKPKDAKFIGMKY